jgi:hypothetical protein
VLLLLAASLHAWILCHTEVTARDSIGFIRYALNLETHPWDDIVRGSEQHPLYPLTVLAVSVPVRALGTGPLADLMVLSAQLASCLAAVLLVLPTYYLGRELFDRRVGFWAAGVFQTLPVIAHVTSDALSEALFLLFVTTAMLLAAQALRRGSGWRYALCGLCAGLAYLTRPEGALVLGAVAVVLLALQAAPAWRRRWRRVLLHAGCLLGPAVLIAAPFVLATGHITTKPTGRHMLETTLACSADAAEAAPATTGGLWAVWWHGFREGDQPTSIWGLRAIGEEFLKSTNYWGGVFALLGLFAYRRRLPAVPGAWVVLLVGLAHALLLWRLAYLMGYLSERHTLLLVLCSVFWAVSAALALADAVAARVLALAGARRGQVAAAAVLMTLLASLGAPSALRPLHYNRAGHRSAGVWLASQAQPGDLIVDPFCWAHYYAGWVFREGKTDDVPEGYRPTVYVVVEESDNPHENLRMLPIAWNLARQGQLVYACPLKSRRGAGEKLLVYRLTPPPSAPPRRTRKLTASTTPDQTDQGPGPR